MSETLELAILPFQLPFMQSAFVVTLMIAIPMALLSCLLVLKGWSLMGDAVSHAVLPGVVIAYIAGIPLAIGAFIAGLVCALLTGFIKENSRIKEDTVLGSSFPACSASVWSSMSRSRALCISTTSCSATCWASCHLTWSRPV
jgi:manganese/iron transport system permease protein